MNRIFESLLLENPIMTQEIIEMKFTAIDVTLRPILSERKPEIGEPKGEEIAVMDANHDT
jgi:hypothetical protein